MTQTKKTCVTAMLFALTFILFFSVLYFNDNKYKTPPPYGKSGIINLTQTDLERPVFLIDGWLYSDTVVSNQPTYIGEFSNLRRQNGQTSPHGSATYRLTLAYQGGPITASLSFPALFHSYRILLDGNMIANGAGSARLTFPLTQGEHTLQVETESNVGYYSGMYHPPALGNDRVIQNATLVQCVAYCLLFFIPLGLSLFTLNIWRQKKDAPAFWFGLLCVSFCAYISYYFIRLFSPAFGEYWFLVQSAALYGLCFCVVRLTALSGGAASSPRIIWIQRIHGGMSFLLLFAALAILTLPSAVRLHGILTDGYYVLTFCVLFYLLIQSGVDRNQEQRFTLYACVVFGIGLLSNLFFSNLFEPILFYWQFEWCGLWLVTLFGAMMSARNRRILAENEAFRTRLEELVEERTFDLKSLLQERKAFFADMAHDLKAPIFATQAFIRAIRENDTGIDGELLDYLDLAEEKQTELSNRLSCFATLNRMDEMGETKKRISVQSLFCEIYEAHHMAAEVQSVFLVIEPPEADGYLFAEPKKLNTLFENLIFNALNAMPEGGTITIGAEIDEDGCHITLADTGSGIPLEEIPHIFRRFYVGRNNKDTGSGLGLYIVKSIVSELKGEITVSSKPGQGTIFYIDLPIQSEK